MGKAMLLFDAKFPCFSMTVVELEGAPVDAKPKGGILRDQYVFTILGVREWQ